MSAKAVTTWYGVCDRCGDEDDDGRATEREARERMWGSGDEELCWECVQAETDD